MFSQPSLFEICSNYCGGSQCRFLVCFPEKPGSFHYRRIKIITYLEAYLLSIIHALRYTMEGVAWHKTYHILLYSHLLGSYITGLGAENR